MVIHVLVLNMIDECIFTVNMRWRNLCISILLPEWKD